MCRVRSRDHNNERHPDCYRNGTPAQASATHCVCALHGLRGPEILVKFVPRESFTEFIQSSCLVWHRLDQIRRPVSPCPKPSTRGIRLGVLLQSRRTPPQRAQGIVVRHRQHIASARRHLHSPTLFPPLPPSPTRTHIHTQGAIPWCGVVRCGSPDDPVSETRTECEVESIRTWHRQCPNHRLHCIAHHTPASVIDTVW